MHNVYAVTYNKLVFGLLEERFGKGEAIVFARAAHAGGQRLPVVSISICLVFFSFSLTLWTLALGWRLRVEFRGHGGNTPRRSQSNDVWLRVYIS